MLYQPQVMSVLADHHIVESNAGMFPERILASDASLLAAHDNLSERAERYVIDRDASVSTVFNHIVAMAHSPEYSRENLDALISNWPRIPLPALATVLAGSAALGERVAELLDPSKPFVGGIRLGALCAANGGALDPSSDLAITARWGIAGKGGVCMPSTGKITERDYAHDERTSIAESAGSLGMSAETAIALLGETCFDVYLNDVAYWRCVPANVWRYTIGGYQVIKKWLSYRERALLGRDLKPEEARYVTEMVRRIAALVLMQPELDANYERVKADV
jgi:hypothetical protein